MPKVYNIKDVKLGCASSNTRYGQRNDALVITLGEESVVSGKFTANSFKAAPIKVAIENFKTPLKGKKVFIYAGNIGVAQGFEILINVAQKLSDNEDIGFLFIGRGSHFNYMKELTKKKSIS